MEKVEEMISHPLLMRQLKRLGIDVNTVPDITKWRELIERIQKTYHEHDQERYLHERAIEVSTYETAMLNYRLEYAQQLANLGYWQYEKEGDRITWSREMYRLFEEDPTQGIPSYQNLMNRFSNEDRTALNELIENAAAKGKKFEFEAQMATAKGNKRWFYIAGERSNHSSNKNEQSTQKYSSTGIVMDITKRKETEEQLAILNKKIVAAAREAGMAEIATTVLHNIGNILNSVSISLELMDRHQKHSEINNMLKVLEMINDHLHDIQTYFYEDPKGKLIPRYLIQSAMAIKNEIKANEHELNRLKENISHVKEIVESQNILSGISSTLIEQIDLGEAINYAVGLTEGLLFKEDIKVEKHCAVKVTMRSDKNKIVQILVNLLQNARDAIVTRTANAPAKTDGARQLSASLSPDKIIQIEVIADGLSDRNPTELEQTVTINVIDNGIGMNAKTLDKIFTYGFTTKEKGHGYGLHSCLLMAKELGGDLKVESQGINRGAKFSLTLPVILKTKDKENAEEYTTQI